MHNAWIFCSSTATSFTRAFLESMRVPSRSKIRRSMRYASKLRISPRRHFLPHQAVRQPRDVGRVARSHFAQQAGGQLVELFLAEAPIAIGRIHIAAAHHV